MSVLNLLQRINEVRKVVTYVKKEVRGENRGASHWDIVRKLRPAMVEHGVMFFPIGIEILETSYEPRSDKPAKWSRMLCKYTFRVANADDLEDFMEIVAISEGLDNSDKATGKAATYAAKTALIQIFNLEIGEDPDFDTIDLDPEIDAERLKLIERVRELAAEHEPDDPDSVINNILTYYSQQYNRKITSITALPMDILDRAIKKLEDKTTDNGQAPKTSKTTTTTAELLFKELQGVAKENGKLNELDARLAVTQWLDKHKVLIDDLPVGDKYKNALSMLQELNGTEWQELLPEQMSLGKQ